MDEQVVERQGWGPQAARFNKACVNGDVVEIQSNSSGIALWRARDDLWRARDVLWRARDALRRAEDVVEIQPNSSGNALWRTRDDLWRARAGVWKARDVLWRAEVLCGEPETEPVGFAALMAATVL